MSVIYYKRRLGALECEKITQSPNGTLELHFEEKIEGTVRLGALLVKIDGKSCIFNTGRLEDGIYKPVIYLKSAILEPESFEVSGGAPRLIPKGDSYVRELSRELEALRREVREVKDKLRLYDEKINGKPIF